MATVVMIIVIILLVLLLESLAMICIMLFVKLLLTLFFLIFILNKMHKILALRWLALPLSILDRVIRFLLLVFIETFSLNEIWYRRRYRLP